MEKEWTLRFEAEPLNVRAENDRKEWMARRWAKKQAEKKIRDAADREYARSRQLRLWEAVSEEARRTGELNFCWPSSISTQVFSWKRLNTLAKCNLLSLRLVGLQLTSVPSNTIHALSNLHTLNLCSNALTHLPDNLGSLSYLTDLILVDNALAYLPDSVTNLTKLEVLDVTSNRLAALPAGIGSLRQIKNFQCEKNHLEVIPRSFGDLDLAIATLNHNKLAELNPGIRSLTNLTSLSMNANGLESIPEVIGSLQKLIFISACNNQLKHLPQSIGSLSELRGLWLDWNLISELPTTFGMLTKLQSLTLLGNPSREPSRDKISEGVEKVLKWCWQRNGKGKKLRRRTIVESLEKCLRTVKKKRLPVDASTFNGKVVRQDKGQSLSFYGFTMEALFRNILPVLREHWKENDVDMDFTYTEGEIVEAMCKHRDAYGPSGRLDQIVRFTKCSCVDENGRRLVCIPPQKGYKCERRAVLLKANLMTAEDFRSQQADVEEQKAIDHKIAIATQRAELFLNSDGGQIFLTEKAETAARRYKLFAQHAKKRKREREKLQKRSKAAHARRRRLRAKLRQKREKRLELLEKQRNELLDRLDEREDDPETTVEDIEKTEEAIDRIEMIMEKPPEDKKLTKIGYETSSSSDNTTSSEEELTSSSGYSELHHDSDEDVAHEGGGEDEDEGEEDESSSSKDSMASTSSSESEGSSSSSVGSGSSGSDEDDSENDPDGGASSASSEEPGEEDPVAVMLQRRAEEKKALLLQADSMNMEKLEKLNRERIRRKYIEHHQIKAHTKVVSNFAKLRKVSENWLGIYKKSTFVAWKEWAMQRVAHRKHDDDEEERLEQARVEGERALHQLGIFNASLWSQHVDVFSDAHYFVHADTGEKSSKPPHFWEEYLHSVGKTPQQAAEEAKNELENRGTTVCVAELQSQTAPTAAVRLPPI